MVDFVQVDQEAVDKGKDDQHDDAGHDEGIQVAGLDLGHGGSAHGRAAPGHDIHDGIGAADDGQQCFLAEAEALDDGQEGGHHDEESGGTGAVQMGHEGGQDDGGHDHHPAFAGLFGQEVDDRDKQTDLIHQGEIGDGKDEQDGGAEHGFHAGTDETADLFCAEPGDHGSDQGQADECHRRADPAFDEDDHQNGHQCRR